MTKTYVSIVKALSAAKERGATMAEYGLMLALIAIVCLAAVGAIGGNLAVVFQDIANAIQGVGN